MLCLNRNPCFAWLNFRFHFLFSLATNIHLFSLPLFLPIMLKFLRFFSFLSLFLVVLQDIQQVKTPEELENFMLKHGENIIDTLGAEVDRLEKELKVIKR